MEKKTWQEIKKLFAENFKFLSNFFWWDLENKKQDREWMVATNLAGNEGDELVWEVGLVWGGNPSWGGFPEVLGITKFQQFLLWAGLFCWCLSAGRGSCSPCALVREDALEDSCVPSLQQEFIADSIQVFNSCVCNCEDFWLLSLSIPVFYLQLFVGSHHASEQGDVLNVD